MRLTSRSRAARTLAPIRARACVSSWSRRFSPASAPRRSWIGLDWHTAFSETEEQLAHALVNAVFFGSFVAGLGRALAVACASVVATAADHERGRDRAAPIRRGCSARAIALSIMLRRINASRARASSATVAASLVSAVALRRASSCGRCCRIAKARGDRLRANAEKRQRRKPLAFVVDRISALAASWIAAFTALGRRADRVRRVRAVPRCADRAHFHGRRRVLPAVACDRGPVFHVRSVRASSGCTTRSA